MEAQESGKTMEIHTIIDDAKRQRPDLEAEITELGDIIKTVDSPWANKSLQKALEKVCKTRKPSDREDLQKMILSLKQIEISIGSKRQDTKVRIILMVIVAVLSVISSVYSNRYGDSLDGRQWQTIFYLLGGPVFGVMSLFFHNRISAQVAKSIIVLSIAGFAYGYSVLESGPADLIVYGYMSGLALALLAGLLSLSSAGRRI